MTGTSMKCWWTIPIPRAMASAVERDRHRLAVQADLPLVGGEQPVEDVHQRRLARPVLARAARGSPPGAARSRSRRWRRAPPKRLVTPAELERGRAGSRWQARARLRCLVAADARSGCRDLARLDVGGDLVDLRLRTGSPAGVEILPSPTPLLVSSKTASLPPLKAPSWTALTVSNTATSTFLTALVRTCGPEVALVGVDADRLHLLLLGRRRSRPGRTGRRPGRRPWRPRRSG